MATNPTDYLQALGGIQNLPNPVRDFNAGIASDQALHTTDLQQQAATLQLQQQQTAQARAQQFQHDLAGLGDDPNPRAIAGMIRKYPEFSKSLKDAHDVQDEAKKDSDFRAGAQMWGAAHSGNYALAAQLVQQYHDASVAAGEAPDPADEAIITALKSGDPAEQKRATSMIGLHVASIRPDKFNETYKIVNDDGKAEGVVVTDGGAMVDKNTGRVMYQAPHKRDIREVKITNPDGSETTQFVDINGDIVPPGSNNRSLPGDYSSGALPGTGALNNPGAIRFDPKNNWQGQTGQQDGFVQFDTPANGARAHQKLIANQIKAGYDTPLSWAQHYAPATDGNDPAAYAQTVASGLGIGVNDKIPISAVPKMAALSAQVESMGTPSPGGAQRSPAGAPGAVASFQTKPGMSGGAFGVDPSLTGPAVIAALPKNVAPRVQQLLDGRSVLTAREKASPLGQQLMQAANQADPTYDESTALKRFQTAKSFAPGGANNKQIVQAQTVIDHLYDMMLASREMGGTGWKGANAVVNYFKGQGGNIALKRYNSALTNLSTELPSFLKGGTATIPEEEAMRRDFDPNDPEETRMANIDQKIELMRGKLEPLAAAYADGMAVQKGPFELLRPEQQHKLDAIQKWMGGHPDARAGSSSAAKPPAIPAGAQPTGKFYQGKPVYLVNGRKWVAD